MIRLSTLACIPSFSRNALFIGAVITVCFLGHFDGTAQSRRPRFVGLQPGVMTEVVAPYYPLSSLDVNIVPVCFQTSINTVTDFKASTIATYQVLPVPRINAVGGEVVFPRFFKAKQRFSERSDGWYLGPAIGGLRDFYRNHYALTAKLEYGALTSGDRRFASGFNVQAGAAYLMRLHRSNMIIPTVAVQLIIGAWLEKELVMRGL